MSHRRLTATAFHEAGHAVMAYLQLIPFRSITIVPAPGSDTLGRVLLGAWPDWANPDSIGYREEAAREYIQRRIRVDMAGLIAEAQHLGRRVRVGMYQDNCNAADLALHLCAGRNDTAQAMLDWLYLNTRDQLTAPAVWPAVQALAEALLDHRTLGIRAAHSCIRSAIGRAVEGESAATRAQVRISDVPAATTTVDSTRVIRPPGELAIAQP
jgi:hypothetical protein